MEKLKQQIESARSFAVDRLRALDMSTKQATIQAAKLQARAEAFDQVLQWMEKS